MAAQTKVQLIREPGAYVELDGKLYEVRSFESVSGKLHVTYCGVDKRDCWLTTAEQQRARLVRRAPRLNLP